jgi:hypothetical protein
LPLGDDIFKFVARNHFNFVAQKHLKLVFSNFLKGRHIAKRWAKERHIAK